MNAATRDRLSALLAQLRAGITGLEALVSDEQADLLGPERKELATALGTITGGSEAVSDVLYAGSQRAPQRGMVLAAAPSPVGITSPADGSSLLAQALRQLALAVRDQAMALRDLADSHRETAARPAEAPAPAAEPLAAPLSRRRREVLPGVRSGVVAEALGISKSVMQARLALLEALTVGAEFEGWRICHVSTGPGGRSRLRWEPVQPESPMEGLGSAS